MHNLSGFGADATLTEPVPPFGIKPTIRRWTL
ncbi:hypothetical protein EDC64_102222 [Aquabacter spiritensis]|uniref:Uncharacterized protein n=1 Tax=Aquabacter spiritensis TaxID=933073 RepID=A0A4R3M1Y8_9HYPH|nr:hypothetical protein EDC64_102222 [Aquabacter spiritensis]